MPLAPILLFVFNRPDHTRRLLQSLRANPEAESSTLYIYSDAPRTQQEAEAVEAVRRVVREETREGFGSVVLTTREENFGLARSVIAGVTERVKQHGRVIVLEDDLLLSPFFLRFMNEALTCYADEPRVGHIQACDFTGDASLPDTFLIKWTGSWGWATWERAWEKFNPDGKALLAELERRKLCRTFDFDGAYPYTRMLRRQTRGENNSWAIRWNASLFLADMLSLNVGRSLVRNTGFDGTGTHCGGGDLYASSLATTPINVTRIHSITENLAARNVLARYYRRTNSFRAKALRRILRTLHGDFSA